MFAAAPIAGLALRLPKSLRAVGAISAGLLAVVGLSGCGGGGGGLGTPADTVPGASQGLIREAAGNLDAFLPNYVPNLIATRRWDKRVVSVSVAPPAPEADVTVIDAQHLVEQAVNLWSQKVGQDVTFTLVSDSSDADVRISWVPAGSLPTESIGRTEVRFRETDQVLVSAAVSVEQSLPESFQVQVIAHELGHALGLEGHSADATDLMYAHSHLPAVVTRSDQNTVLWRYSATQASGRSAGAATVSADGTTSVECVCGLEK